MATTATHIPVEVYLDTSYEHDCDYVNGEVLERPLDGWDHATWQAALVMFFGARQKEWGIKARPELRVNVSERTLGYLTFVSSAPLLKDRLLKIPRWQCLKFFLQEIPMQA